MIISSQSELERYRRLAKDTVLVLEAMAKAVAIGTTPLAVDSVVTRTAKALGATPNFTGVAGHKGPYKYASCIAVNQTVVHGVPDKRPFRAGDVVKLDVGLTRDGLHTDACVTVGIAPVATEMLRLITTTKDLVYQTALQATPGTKSGDLGFLMHTKATKAGYDTLKEYTGHGIGHSLHEPPNLPAWGSKGQGRSLALDMVVCVEAQVVTGSDDIRVTSDGWSVVTKDGGFGAMFEYMVRVDQIPEILTDTTHIPLVVGE